MCIAKLTFRNVPFDFDIKSLHTYDLVLLVDFSPIGWDPTVSHLLAGIAGLIAVDVKDSFFYGMG